MTRLKPMYFLEYVIAECSHVGKINIILTQPVLGPDSIICENDNFYSKCIEELFSKDRANLIRVLKR